MTPRVSVIMAAYNAERFVAEAVRSVLAQTMRDWELIVVDDASTDGTWDVLQGFTDARIVLLRNETNLGAAVTRNRALEQARGEYIAILDADDVAMPERLEKQVAFLDEHPATCAVGCWAEKVDETGRVLEVWETPTQVAQIEFAMTHTCPLLHPSALVRRDALVSVGGYDASYPCAQDYDLLVRLALEGHRFACIPEALIRYRSSPGQISAARRAEQSRHAQRAAERFLQARLGWSPSPRELASYRAILDGAAPLTPETDVRAGIRALRHAVREFCLGLSAADRAAVRDYVRYRALSTAALSRKSAPSVCTRLSGSMMAPEMGGLTDLRVWMLLGSAARHSLLQMVPGLAPTRSSS